MEYVKLTDICNPKQWKTLSTNQLKEEGQYLVYGANGVIGRYDNYNHEKETVLITCRGATCGNIHISKEKSYINGNAMALDDLNEEKCLKKYLYYFLRQYNMKKIVSGSAQPQITVQSLKKVNIKIINISEQVGVITKLDKVQEIIDIRKRQIKELDYLIKSQFLAMFGEPVLNNKHWEMGNIRDLVSEAKYGTSKPSSKSGKYKYLRMNNITCDGKLDLKDIKYIDIPKNELEKCIARKGDILFNRTNSRELVGKTCVYDINENMVIAGFIIRVRVNQKANPYFISEYLNTKFIKKTLYNMCKNASGQSNINAQELQDIVIYIPPIDLQNKFADIVQKVDKQKLNLQDSLQKLQSLQESLMNRYFG